MRACMRYGTFKVNHLEFLEIINIRWKEEMSGEQKREGQDNIAGVTLFHLRDPFRREDLGHASQLLLNDNRFQ